MTCSRAAGGQRRSWIFVRFVKVAFHCDEECIVVRLKRLELFGFKSFADRTVIEFSAGITAIVGPNGCGKSNIADAFRWVMGEQSAKSLRGGKMPDVIFAGTASRKGLALAEATLTFTDVGESLPVDYEELEITRRLYRTGESEYFLNRRAVRLKDIQSLLLGSGIGKDAFAIFEQGKIDQVIHWSPLERRPIFEETAGISRFLHRKREALAKLDHTQQNVTRLQDIESEVRQRMEVLEQQAKLAKEHKEKKAELDLLEKSVAGAKWRQLQEKLEAAFQRNQQCFTAAEEAAKQQEAVKERRHKIQSDLSLLSSSLEKEREALYRLRADKEVLGKGVQTHQEQLEDLRRREKAIFQEAGLLKQAHHQRLESIDLQRGKEKAFHEKSEEQKKLVAEQVQKVTELEAQVKVFQEEQRQTAQKHLQAVKKAHEAESDQQKARLRLEGLKEKMGQLSRRKEEGLQRQGELQKQRDKSKERVQQVLEGVNEETKKLAALGERCAALAGEVEAKSKALGALQKQVTEGRARRTVLSRLREQREGLSQGAKRLLQESANPKSALHEKVCSLFEKVSVPRGKERAFAAALRSYDHTLVVETYDDLTEVVRFARKNELKDYSLVCLEQLSSLRDEILSGGLQPLVEEGDLEPLARCLVGQVGWVKATEEGLRFLKEGVGLEIAAEEGLYIDAKRVCFFAPQGESSPFLREAELQTLSVALQEQESSLKQLEESLNALEEQKRRSHEERSALDKSVRRSEMTLVEANFSLQRVQEEIKKALEEQTRLEGELQNGEVERSEWASLLEQAERKVDAARLEVKELETAMARQQGEVKDKEALLNEKKQSLRRAEEAYQKTASSHRETQHALELLELQEKESQNKEAQSHAAISRVSERQREVQHLLKKEIESVQRLEQGLEHASGSVKSFEVKVDQAKEAAKRIEEEGNVCSQEALRREKEQLHGAAEVEQLQLALVAVSEEFKERCGADLKEVIDSSEPLSQSLEKEEKRLRSLRQQVLQVRDVNMTAIEEFDSHQQRHQFLTQQLEDLHGSQEELMDFVSKLDAESRKVFKEVFHTIRTHFIKNFHLLFQGGEADLILEGDADVLEAGIDIVAKPPGKQMRSIHLLSGGEKCLTAIALLFALFEVKAAPFCILDEIDAPLDDANVERLLDIVRAYSAQCQFIVVTHNKRTMGAAHTLIGVSMEEKGVSKLLSMAFQKDLQEPSQVVVSSLSRE